MATTPNRAQGKRRLVERALELAADGRWEEAEQTNRDILTRFPRDFEAMNRLGKSLAEQHRYAEAGEAYQNVLVVDATNMIARKNVARMELLSGQNAPKPAPTPDGARPQARQMMFIEEPGRSAMIIVESDVAQVELSKLIPGDQLDLRPHDESVGVYSWDGTFIGYLPARVAQRLTSLMTGGNRYMAAVAAVLDGALRVVVRETYRSLENGARLSFPTMGKTAALPRAYTRDIHRPALDPSLYDDEDGDDDTDDDEDELEPDSDEPEPAEDEELIEDSRRPRDEDELG